MIGLCSFGVITGKFEFDGSLNENWSNSPTDPYDGRLIV